MCVILISQNPVYEFFFLQTFLVWQLMFSTLLLRRKYTINQLVGCLLVASGVIVAITRYFDFIIQRISILPICTLQYSVSHAEVTNQVRFPCESSIPKSVRWWTLIKDIDLKISDQTSNLPFQLKKKWGNCHCIPLDICVTSIWSSKGPIAVSLFVELK